MRQSIPYNNQRYYLLKAESLCADLIENGIGFEDLFIRFAGSFRKSYRNDIEEVTFSGEGRKSPVTIELNRDGIYDKLPEGLFHQTRGSSRTASVSAMVTEYRQFREEERMARKFFQPVEQEIFCYQVMIEQLERKIQFGILNGDAGAAFYDFWDIDPRLPKKAVATLILIMPWLRTIKRDKDLTAKALSMALAKEVSIVEKVSYTGYSADAGFVLGGASYLSRNTVCGASGTIPLVQWVFTINGLSYEEMEDYLPGKGYGQFISRFKELFIPVEIDALFDFANPMEINPEKKDAILGYGYYL